MLPQARSGPCNFSHPSEEVYAHDKGGSLTKCGAGGLLHEEGSRIEDVYPAGACCQEFESPHTPLHPAAAFLRTGHRLAFLIHGQPDHLLRVIQVRGTLAQLASGALQRALGQLPTLQQEPGQHKVPVVLVQDGCWLSVLREHDGPSLAANADLHIPRGEGPPGRVELRAHGPHRALAVRDDPQAPWPPGAGRGLPGDVVQDALVVQLLALEGLHKLPHDVHQAEHRPARTEDHTRVDQCRAHGLLLQGLSEGHQVQSAEFTLGELPPGVLLEDPCFVGAPRCRRCCEGVRLEEDVRAIHQQQEAALGCAARGNLARHVAVIGHALARLQPELAEEVA
mmetsp:Transcript_73896/g.238840  ORF Transcript_73896/g.238840 Transcript_73896/m.238840 type:complete len:338 (+) Transcript_73896:464-1477(+)